MRHTFAVRLLESARGGNIQSVLRFCASQLGDDVKTVVDTYPNGGHEADDWTQFDGALVAEAPRPRPAGARGGVVRELRAVR